MMCVMCASIWYRRPGRVAHVMLCIVFSLCSATTGTQCAASQSELSSVADCRSSPQISTHTATVQPQDHLRGAHTPALRTACTIILSGGLQRLTV